MGLFKVVILIGILVALYWVIQKNKEGFDDSRVYVSRWPVDGPREFNDAQELSKIKYVYGTRPIDEQFKDEQERCVNTRIIYPNTYIEKVNVDTQEQKYGADPRGAVYEDNVESFIETKARFDYKMYEPRTIGMSGVQDPTNFHDGKAPSIKEIYDKQFVDFKELQPKKVLIDDKENANTQEGASNLTFITPDKWVYAEEKIENGGAIVDGLYANDPLVANSVATF